MVLKGSPEPKLIPLNWKQEKANYEKEADVFLYMTGRNIFTLLVHFVLFAVVTYNPAFLK